MSVDPIACTLLAAASVSRGLRRAIASRSEVPHLRELGGDASGSAVAAARLRARQMNVPDSAIELCLQSARESGQSDLVAINRLIEGLHPSARRG